MFLCTNIYGIRLLSGDLLDPLQGPLMVTKPLVWGTAAPDPRGEKQPRLVYSSHPSMENQLIAVIVRFPSALPTTKSRDPGGHLSVHQDLLDHQEAEFLTSSL